MNGRKSRKHLSRLTFAALMTAVSVVIGIVCKNFFTYLIYYRLTFENMPIILAGYLLGPVYGGAVALAADAISCLCSSNPAINPIISAGALLVGVISGALPRVFKKRSNAVLILTVATAHLIGQVAVKSVGKIIYFGMPVYGIAIGLLLSVIAGCTEFLLIKIIMKNSFLKGELERLI